MSIKHYFANMGIAGKSADISQNIRLKELFQNLKKSYMQDFSYLLELFQEHRGNDMVLSILV